MTSVHHAQCTAKPGCSACNLLDLSDAADKSKTIIPTQRVPVSLSHKTAWQSEDQQHLPECLLLWYNWGTSMGSNHPPHYLLAWKGAGGWWLHGAGQGCHGAGVGWCCATLVSVFLLRTSTAFSSPVLICFTQGQRRRWFTLRIF